MKRKTQMVQIQIFVYGLIIVTLNKRNPYMNMFLRL